MPPSKQTRLGLSLLRILARDRGRPRRRLEHVVVGAPLDQAPFPRMVWRRLAIYCLATYPTTAFSSGKKRPVPSRSSETIKGTPWSNRNLVDGAHPCMDTVARMSSGPTDCSKAGSRRTQFAMRSMSQHRSTVNHSTPPLRSLRRRGRARMTSSVQLAAISLCVGGSMVHICKGLGEEEVC